MWVKICANTSLLDAQAAVEAGADALGFIFAPSPREVTVGQVREISGQLPRHVERYGVFVHPSFEQVVATVEQAGLTGVQLHATNDPGLAARLREHFTQREGLPRLGLLRVLHYPREQAPREQVQPAEHAAESSFAAQLGALRADHAADHAIDAVLVDSRSAMAQGGTGVRFDWAEASGAFLSVAPHLRLIVAGGLAPENVAEAIRLLRPWGVDVVSGVEASPGRKDPARVRAFIARARAAAREVAATQPMSASVPVRSSSSVH